MTQKPLYRSLDANLALLEEMFGRSDDFYTALMLAGIQCAIVMFTGLSRRKSSAAWRWTRWTAPRHVGRLRGLCDYLLTQSRVPTRA